MVHIISLLDSPTGKNFGKQLALLGQGAGEGGKRTIRNYSSLGEGLYEAETPTSEKEVLC